LLNQLTARCCGLEVILGSTESATLGNFAVQLAALDNRNLSEEVTADAVASWAARLSGSSSVPSLDRVTH
jgi:rhamnulokinase